MPEFLDLPALVIGLLLGAYWVRVLALVRKTKRRTGRAANFLPPEPLGRALRIVWYPATVAWIVLPILRGIGVWSPTGMLYGQPAVRWLGVAVAVAAFWGTLVCWRRMGKEWRMGIDPEERTGLVVQGAFGYVRHPIYALQQVLLVATAVVVPSPVLIGIVVLLMLLLQWEAAREERHMIATHGETYERYRGRVGRFVPRSLRPFDPAAGASPAASSAAE